MGGVFGIAFSVLFVGLSVATTFLFTVSIFKKQTNRKFNILLCVFSAITLIIYMLIPTQTYVVSLYALVRKVSFLRYIQFIYIILSLMIIVTNILFAIKRSDKIQWKNVAIWRLNYLKLNCWLFDKNMYNYILWHNYSNGKNAVVSSIQVWMKK